MKPWLQSLGFLLALGLGGVGSAAAAGSEWDGGGGDSSLVTPNNWDINTTPTFGAATDLVFGALPATNQSIQVNASFDVQHLTFSGATRPSYAFSGTATPTLTLFGNITVTDGSNAGVSFANSLGLTLVGGAHTVHLNSIADPLRLESWITETGGAASLTKTGSGTLSLSGDNTYSGGTVIEAGAIIAENATGSATGTGSVTIQAGATLQIGIGAAGVGGTTGSVAGSIANNGSLVYYRSNAVTAAGISGSGAVNHLGSGTLTFSGTSNTYSGGTYIYDNGTVVDANAGALPSAGAIAMHGGTLNIDFDETVKGLGDLIVDTDRKGGTVNLASTATLTLAGGGSDFSGKIQGDGKLVIGTGAVQQLKGIASTFTGGTAIDGGTLEIAGDGSLGDASGGLSFNAGTLKLLGSWDSARNITINSGGGTIQTNTYEARLTGTLSGSGALSYQGTGVLELGGNNVGLTGGITVTNGVLDFTATANLGAAANLITLNGGYLRTKAAVGDFTHPIMLDAGGGNLNSNGFDSVFSGKISGGALSVRAGTGGGSITLNNASNDYTGPTYIAQDNENTAVPTLKISADRNLGLAPSTPTLNHLVLDGGTLVATGSFTLDPNRGIAITSRDGAIGVESGQSVVYAGNILGDGALTKTGDGNLTLGGGTGGISTFTGGLTVEQGTLTLGRSSYRDIETQEFESSPVGAGTLTLLGGTVLAATPESDGLDDGILLFNDLHLNSNESHTVTIDTSGDDLTLAGNIGGDEGLGLLKTGTGTLTLSGQNNTFDGGLELAGGTLKLVPMPEISSGLVGSGTLTLQRGTTLTLPSNMSLSLANDILLDDPDSGTAGASIDVQQEGAGMSELELSGVIGDGPQNEGAALSLIKTGSGALKLGGANTFSGALVVEGGAVVVTRSSQTEGTIIAGPVGVGTVKMGDGTKLAAAGASSITLHNPVELGGKVGFGGQAYPLVLAGGISEGESTGSVRTGGQVVFQGENTYSGWTEIDQGSLRAEGVGSLPTTTALGMSANTTLYIDESQTIARFLGSIADEAEIVIGDGKMFTVAPTAEALGLGNAGFFGGELSGSGAFKLAGVSGSLLWLEGDLTYTGGTSIESGATLKISGSATTTTALAQSIINNGTLGFYRDDNSLDLVVAGTISGSGRLVSNSGFTVLSPTAGNGYAGGTEINGGVLAAGPNTTGAFGSGGITVNGGVVALMNGAYVSNDITLASGSTIGGSGTFASSVIIGSGVTLKPETNDENTIGTLTFNELTLQGGGIFEWNAASPASSDRVVIANPTTLTFETGADPFKFKIVPLSAAGVVGAASGFNAGQSYSFTVFQAPSESSLVGFADFNYTIDGSLFSSYMSGVGEWSFSLEQSGASILLNFTPVPEPSTWALLITGLAVLGVGALRRRQRS